MLLRHGGGYLGFSYSNSNLPLHFLHTGDHFLTFKFTVTFNGQPRCEIQGQVNGNTFIHYTYGSNKVTLISVPEMSATQAWNQQREALQYMMEEIMKIMFDRKAEIAATGSKFTKPRVEVEWGWRIRGRWCLCKYWKVVPPNRLRSQCGHRGRSRTRNKGLDTRWGQRLCQDPWLTCFPWGWGRSSLPTGQHGV